MACTTILNKPWYSSVSNTEQTLYKPVLKCTYSTVLVTYNNYNAVNFKNKYTPVEDFYDIHEVVLDGISETTALPVQTVNCGFIITTDITTMRYYVVKFFQMLRNYKRKTPNYKLTRMLDIYELVS